MTSWNKSTGWDGAPEEYFQSYEERLEESLCTGSTTPQDLTNEELDMMLNDPVHSPTDQKLREEKNRRTQTNHNPSSETAAPATSAKKTRDSISEKELYNQTAERIQQISQRVAGNTLNDSDLKDLVKEIHTEYNTKDKLQIIADLHSNDTDRQEDALRKVGRDLGYI